MPKPLTLKARKKGAFHSRKKSPLGQEHGRLPGKMKGLPQKERLVLEGSILAPPIWPLVSALTMGSNPASLLWRRRSGSSFQPERPVSLADATIDSSRIKETFYETKSNCSFDSQVPALSESPI